METALESDLSALESRAGKLHKWVNLNLEVQTQEVASLEAAVAALQQQQQQLQQQRLTALPAIEEAAVTEVSQMQLERVALTQQMTEDGRRLLDGLRQFQKAKEGSWPSAVPAEKAKENCEELWASLARVKETRKAAAVALTVKLNDALREAENAIVEDGEARRQSEAALNEMLLELRKQALSDLAKSRRRRQQGEEQILSLLEHSCARMEAAILSSTKIHSDPEVPL